MNPIIFLTGKPRMGKTTAIKNIINGLGPDRCGGFYTEEVRDAVNRIGFRCVTLDGDRAEIANVNSTSNLRVGRYGVEIDRFEKIAVAAVRESLKLNKITVIDEVGFMQMLSVPFQQLIHEVVSGRRNVVLGTICLDSHPEIDKIKQYPGIQIYTLNEENRDELIEVVSDKILNILK